MTTLSPEEAEKAEKAFEKAEKRWKADPGSEPDFMSKYNPMAKFMKTKKKHHHRPRRHAAPGSQVGAHGCAEYLRYCHSTKKCFRPWMETCPGQGQWTCP